MGGAPPPPPGLASPDPKSDHFFRHFSGVFGGPPGPPKTVKNDPPDPQKRPPEDLPETSQKPPQKGGFLGGFRGVFGGYFGVPGGGVFGGPGGPPEPPKRVTLGAEIRGVAPRGPPERTEGVGGLPCTLPVKPRKPSDRGATFCGVSPPKRNSRETDHEYHPPHEYQTRQPPTKKISNTITTSR